MCELDGAEIRREADWGCVYGWPAGPGYGGGEAVGSPGIGDVVGTVVRDVRIVDGFAAGLVRTGIGGLRVVKEFRRSLFGRVGVAVGGERELLSVESQPAGPAPSFVSFGWGQSE